MCIRRSHTLLWSVDTCVTQEAQADALLEVEVEVEEASKASTAAASSATAYVPVSSVCIFYELTCA